MNHKRGDTFYYAVPIPLSKADGFYKAFKTPRAQIRSLAGNLVAECQVSWADPETTRVLHLLVGAPIVQTWPLGTLQIDIEFTRLSDLFVMSTMTGTFECVNDITKPLVV
jgi:hypothetical protein